ncbi:hypothetical protein AYI69_g8095 [Smittium culicis]|uniref:Uncharacterized protein n=1 Tax=Smittium culicis TaxID=133412 RepID=A0A1R1XM77_9FUNG|nr:hypothetical protein AYI69_g8095 [Smittium culicis]
MIFCATPRNVVGWDNTLSFEGTPLIRDAIRHQFLLEVIGGTFRLQDRELLLLLEVLWVATLTVSVDLGTRLLIPTMVLLMLLLTVRFSPSGSSERSCFTEGSSMDCFILTVWTSMSSDLLLSCLGTSCSMVLPSFSASKQTCLRREDHTSDS